MSDPTSSSDPLPNTVDFPIPVPASRAPDPPTGGKRLATTAQTTKALPPVPKRRALTATERRAAATAALAEHPNLLVGQAPRRTQRRNQDAEELGQELAHEPKTTLSSNLPTECPMIRMLILPWALKFLRTCICLETKS